jgi:glycine cleavage system H protein
MSEDLLFSKTHEWVRVESDASGAKIATVGISAFAVEALTDLVYIELPQAGRQVAAGEPFGEIESVKAVSDLYSPVAGQIIEVNTAIIDHLDRLSADPYQAGWLVKIKLSDEAGLRELLDPAAYQKQCEEASNQ